MRFFMSGMAAVLLVATTGPTSAGQQNIIIREHLGQRWTRELVTYPFAAEKGQCHPNSIKLIGPDGPVPVQVTDVVTWPDAPHVKTAKLTFVVDVASGANDTYKVQYAEVATRLVRPKTDLKVARGQGQIEFVTDQFGIRLLVGEKTYPEPVAPAEAPAPVLAMRQPDGTWFGGSRLYGATKIKSYSATLAAGGPALGRVDYRYTYADGVTMDLSVQLAAGDSQVRYAMNVLPVDREQVLKDLRGGGFDWRNHPSLAPRGPSKQDGWRLLLSPGLEPLQLVAVPEFGQVRWGKREYVRGKPVFNPVTVDIEKEPVGLLVSLVPWADWWEQMTKTEMTLKTAQRGEVLTARSLEPGEWVEPAEPGEWISWGNRRSTQKWVPLVHGGEGEVFFQVSRASGRRTFLVGGAGQPLGRRFNELKDYVLDWEPGKLGHPRLFLNAEQLAEARKHKPDAERLARLARLAGSGIPSKPHRVDGRALAIWLLTGDPEQARKHKLVERLRRHLALLGKFDTMRHASLVCSLYDGVMGSELVTEADRKEFRAGLAYLAYLVADPATWSMERGYCSGNLNMSVAHVLNRGILACALADHPMAETWKTSALAMLDRWLETRVGPDGEWPESVANYAFVSVGHLLPMAIAARNAGFANYIDDPRMRRLMLYLAKQYTPPDPRHTEGDKDGAMGLLPPVGRSGAGGRNSQQGLMARATATSDPEYSAIQQWTWLRAGQPRGWPLAAWGEVALDPTLPAKRPDWEFDVFGRTGVIMRHGLGTPAEWYIYCMCEQDFAYHTESLGFPIIFARGAPVSARFSGGYAEREELFISRVLPARPRGDNEYRWSHFEHLGPRKIAATSGLPRQQYVRMEQTLQRTRRQYHEGSAFNKMRPLPEWPAVANKAKLPIEMIRQVLFLRDADPAGANYLVVRDTVPTDQPTMWQFWTISEKIGTPEQAAQREAFLADAPKMQPGETRKLPHGPRYTAVGQFGVDLEFFVALPTDTPRHALHWSREYHYSPINQFKEYMDMLHLQRAGAGDYFVAIFPRKPDEPMPRFQRLGDHAIQVSGPWGTDTVFLSAETVQATAGAASFEGTAGSAQDRSGELILCLGAGGKVGYKQYRLSCEHPVALHAAPGRLLLELPANPEGTTVRLTGPGALALEEVKPGLSLRRADGGYAVDVSPGMTRVRMTKQ